MRMIVVPVRFSVIVLGFLVFAVLVPLSNSFADESRSLRKAIAKCAEIENSIRRTECYDALATRFGLAPEVNQRATASKWRITIDQSKFDDSQNVYLHVAADESVKIGRYDTVLPDLWVRCLENKTSIFINYDHFLGSDDILVEYRIDRANTGSNSWNISTNNTSVGIWSGRPAISFIKRLFGKEKLLVRLTPYSESPVAVSFTIAGLRDEIGPLAKACHWTP